MQLIRKDNSIVRNLHASMTAERRTQFTLVEIMVVIVIIAVILGITIPVFNSIGTRKSVDAAASMIADSLRLARATAVQQRRRVTLVFSESDKGAAYEMKWIIANSASEEYEVVSNTKKEYLPLGALVNLTADVKVTFKPNGRPVGTVPTIKVIEAIIDHKSDKIVLNPENYSHVRVNQYTGIVSVGREAE